MQATRRELADSRPGEGASVVQAVDARDRMGDVGSAVAAIVVGLAAAAAIRQPSGFARVTLQSVTGTSALLTIRNEGPQSLSVQSVESSCVCLQLNESGPFTVVPAGARTLDVEIDPLMLEASVTPGVFVRSSDPRGALFAPLRRETPPNQVGGPNGSESGLR